ncbi:hypothetical protein [Curtobacterium sp. BH-2-1-1]|uniref:hypothetical protein n=1 Tax=Curtobacterium sp. BH-2-1-1 TaxID=1905847 RepID=UPI0012EAF987|nr:hypothetical protein [Curtobacterium sp. BH-2-1-1]
MAAVGQSRCVKILRSQLTPEERIRDDRRGVRVGWAGVWFGAGMCWLIGAVMAWLTLAALLDGHPEDAPWIPGTMFWVLSIVAVFVILGLRRMLRDLRDATATLIEHMRQDDERARSADGR